MAHDDKHAESVGPNYDAEMMSVVRQKTRRIVHKIAEGIAPGMYEEEAMEMARKTLKNAGMLRGWHGIHVRFGANTLKAFGAPSDPGVMLQENDIFFIDIGPVWRHWEGDAGETFVVGDDPDMHRAARDVQSLFGDVHRKWRTDGSSGQMLYRYAQVRALEMGWQLNLDMSGHRLSDFPHAANHKGSLSSASFKPSSDLWVLEIQIRHPVREFSAFYEDLLIA